MTAKSIIGKGRYLGCCSKRLSEIKARLRGFPKADPALCSVLPTPIEKLGRLSKRCVSHDIFFKREDLTGLAFGGNKTRMLQYILGKAQAKGTTDIVGGAGFESNYCRQLACACAKLGIKAHLIVRRTQNDDPNLRAAVSGGNLLPMTMSGADVYVLDETEESGHHVSSNHHERMREKAEALRKSGRNVMLLRTASDDDDIDVLATMALGYVEAGIELVEQIEAYASSGGGGNDDEKYFGRPEVFVSSADTTHAGLAALAKLLDSRPYRLVSVAPFSSPVTLTWGSTHEEAIASIANRVIEMLGFEEKSSISPEDINVEHGFVGDGYGVSTPESLDAMSLLAREEGILLDPIYTSKAVAGVLEHVTLRSMESPSSVSEDPKKKKMLVYIHTGGLPALYSTSFQGTLETNIPGVIA